MVFPQYVPMPRFGEVDIAFAFLCGVFLGLMVYPACGLIVALICSAKDRDENS